MSTQNALKNLYELRAVLERMGGTDLSLYETMADDVDRAIKLTDDSMAELTDEEPEESEE